MKRLIGVILLFAIVFPVFAVNSNSLNIFDSNKLNRLKGFEVGEKLSDIQYDLFENSSWTRVSPHGSGPQGLDHLYLKFDDKGNIKGLLIGESKFTTKPAPLKLNQNTKDGVQMSDAWINSPSRLGDRAKQYATFAEADKLGIVAFAEVPDDAINVMPIDGKGSVYFESNGKYYFYSPDEAMTSVAVRSQKATNASMYLDAASKGKISYRKELSWITVEDGKLWQTIYKPKAKVLGDKATQLEDLLRLDTKGFITFKKPSSTVDTIKVGDDLVFFKENGKTFFYSSDTLFYDKATRVKTVQSQINSLNIEVKNSKEEEWIDTAKTMIDAQRAEKIINSPEVTDGLARAYGLADSSVLGNLSYAEKVNMLDKTMDVSTLKKLASSGDNLIEIETRLGKKLSDATADDLAKIYEGIEIDVNLNSKNILNKVTTFMAERPYKAGGVIVGTVVGINAAWQYLQTGKIDVQKLAETGIVTAVGYSVNIGMDRAADLLSMKLVAKIDDLSGAAKAAKAAKVADATGDAIKTADVVSDVGGSVAKATLPVVAQVGAEVATDLAIYAARMGIEYAAGAEISKEQVIDRMGIAAKYYSMAATASAGIGAGVGFVVGSFIPDPGTTVAGTLTGARLGTLVLYNTAGNWWAEKKIDEEIHEIALEEVNNALTRNDYGRLALLAEEEFDIMMAGI
ncbi:MAG: hypothetical protein MSS69_05125 [Spirochaetales bacterium]|nr:hypothetical protein [Spirochaetales bacterium]